MDKTVGGIVFASAYALLSVRDSELRERYTHWRLGRLPLMRVGEVGEAAVRVEGRVRAAAGEALLAPLSDRPCVAFRLRIAEIHGRRFRRTVLELRGAVPFVFEDESGLALVEVGDGERIALAADLTGTIGGFRKRRPEVAAGYHVFSLLEAHGTNTVTWLGGEKAYAFEESILATGGLVAVGGVGAWEPYADGERPTSRVFPERLVFRDAPACRLRIGSVTPAVPCGGHWWGR